MARWVIHQFVITRLQRPNVFLLQYDEAGISRVDKDFEKNFFCWKGVNILITYRCFGKMCFMFVKSNSWHCQFLYISNWWNIKVLSLSLLIGFRICILLVFYHSPSSQIIQSNKRISVKVQIHHLSKSKSMLWYRRSVYLKIIGKKKNNY